MAYKSKASVIFDASGKVTEFTTSKGVTYKGPEAQRRYEYSVRAKAGYAKGYINRAAGISGQKPSKTIEQRIERDADGNVVAFTTTKGKRYTGDRALQAIKASNAQAKRKLPQELRATNEDIESQLALLRSYQHDRAANMIQNVIREASKHMDIRTISNTLLDMRNADYYLDSPKDWYKCDQASGSEIYAQKFAEEFTRRTGISALSDFTAKATDTMWRDYQKETGEIV